MKYTVLATLSLLGSALAAPQTEIQSSVMGTEITSVTGLSVANSRSQITLSGTNTANATASGESTTPTTVAATTAAAAGISIAVFTVPNGGVYTASLISSVAQIAGQRLSAGGAAGFVGGVQVSVASNGVVEGGQTALFNEVTGSSTTVVVSASSASGSSSATVVSETTTVPVAASTAGSSAASAASASGSRSSSAAAAMATAKPKSAVAALGGVAGLLCLLG